MDPYTLLGWLTGLFLIKADMEPSTLIRTALFIHMLDGLLCGVVANHTGRNRTLWMLAGLLLGIWALAPLFLLAEIDGALSNAARRASPRARPW